MNCPYGFVGNYDATLFNTLVLEGLSLFAPHPFLHPGDYGRHEDDHCQEEDPGRASYPGDPGIVSGESEDEEYPRGNDRYGDIDEGAQERRARFHSNAPLVLTPRSKIKNQR